MKPNVDLNTARPIIQGWFRRFCEDHGKTEITLEIEAENDEVQNAFKVTHPETGRSAPIYWSAVNDFAAQGSAGIPGDLKAGIWDSFGDLF